MSNTKTKDEKLKEDLIWEINRFTGSRELHTESLSSVLIKITQEYYDQQNEVLQKLVNGYEKEIEAQTCKIHDLSIELNDSNVEADKLKAETERLKEDNESTIKILNNCRGQFWIVYNQADLRIRHVELLNNQVQSLQSDLALCKEEAEKQQKHIDYAEKVSYQTSTDNAKLIGQLTELKSQADRLAVDLIAWIPQNFVITDHECTFTSIKNNKEVAPQELLTEYKKTKA